MEKIVAAGWRRLCTSFGKESTDLCNAIAAVARRLCTDYVDPSGLQAFLACRLIPIDKRPGVRPIGVCEVLRRIIGKTVMEVVKVDVMKAAGGAQLCAGQEAGAEAAVHAIRAMFEHSATDAILFVIAANAFNNINRRTALLNIRFICPSIAVVLINCYRESTSLYAGGSVLLSQEGTTQGDPLAMAMFALASIPLIQRIASPATPQTWFADDAASGGKLRNIRSWWDQLNIHGPRFGYFPNAAKTFLLVKSPKLAEAEDVFSGTGIHITDEGRRYLGGAIGSDEFIQEVLRAKVAEWTSDMERLTNFAFTQPHAAFASLTHGIVGRWVYTLRVTRLTTGELLQPLEDKLRQSFLPALTGQSAPNNALRELLALPCRLGGMGISNPVTMSVTQFDTSLKICQPLLDIICGKTENILAARVEQQNIKHSLHQYHRRKLAGDATAIHNALPNELRACATAAQERGVSAWLTALPIAQHGFALNKSEFRDAIAMRYNWPLQRVPENCACGQAFSVHHALICRCGGFITHRHNQVRDFTANLLREVSTNVTVEPELQPLSGEQLGRTANSCDLARVDIRAHSFWTNGQDAFFDVRVFYPFASSYRSQKLEKVYKQHEAKKRQEYGGRITDIEHGTFTPLVLTTGGGMAREATVFYKRLASLLAEKRNENYPVVMGWLRCTLSFSLLHSAIMCVRGTKRKNTRVDSGSDCVAEATAASRLVL